MGCPRRQAHTRNQISRGDTASVFGCRVPLDRGGRRGWLAPNSPLFSQELDEWVEDSAVHVSQRQSNWFWIRDKKMKTCLVKLTCHTAGCSAQVDDPTAPSLKAGFFFIYIFAYCQFFDCLLASTLEGDPYVVSAFTPAGLCLHLNLNA